MAPTMMMLRALALAWHLLLPLFLSVDGFLTDRRPSSPCAAAAAIANNCQSANGLPLPLPTFTPKPQATAL
eukprot:CAMPEP_0183783006 /NCGR_PEP_ID=MMETSP0739-20130205/62473_1 /TAXON_ID=385413 /ORGANISM="Thalassiosira miniscula, Strain CCMP1093" /LENGTH=70 /DNA_ID=CAMNT_0026026587 /DNA_START=12 /DNA_END=220 /DNA_ORIENTATION=+